VSQTQISPVSAAQHYATAAEFWEGQAKLLRHQLDTANSAASALRRLVAHGSQEDIAEAKAKLIEADEARAQV
jgi:hypothetical protein